MSGKTSKPAIPNRRPLGINEDLWQFLSSMKEILESYEGSRATEPDRIVTRDDLRKLGFNSAALSNEQPSYIMDELVRNSNIGGRDSTYSSMYISNPALVLANSISTVNGTVVTGSVTDTNIINQTYYQVQETGQFQILPVFTGLTGDPHRVKITGRYEGNVGHNVKIYAYNYDTSAWDALTSATRDFTSSSSDASFTFDFEDNLPGVLSDYVSSGQVEIKIEHLSPSNSSHNFYLDYIAVEQVNLELSMAGTYYALTGLTEGENNNVTMNGSAGTWTIQKPGVYSVDAQISFSGSDDVTIEGELFVNGEDFEPIAFSRKLGSSGDVGSASGGGLVALTKGDVLSWRFESDSDDTILSIYHFHMKLEGKNT